MLSQLDGRTTLKEYYKALVRFCRNHTKKVDLVDELCTSTYSTVGEEVRESTLKKPRDSECNTEVIRSILDTTVQRYLEIFDIRILQDHAKNKLVLYDLLRDYAEDP
jgi:hypothetical protein